MVFCSFYRRFALTVAVATLAVTQGQFAAGQSVVWGKFQNGGQPYSAESELPVEWSPEENIAWTADITGYGQSTPVIAHGLIVVTSTSGDNKDQYHVSAYDVQSGKKAWEVTRDNPSPYKNTPMVSRAAPSAIATKAGFAAFFEGGLLVAVDGDGNVSWEQDLVAKHGQIEARHGLAASLEQDTERIFVWVERSQDPYVLAVNPETGEQIWRSAGVGAASWSSPRLVPVGEGAHLVCSASGKIVGLDPVSGQRLWEFDKIANNSSCTPMPVGKGQFLIGSSDGRGAAVPGAAAESNGLVQITKQDDGSFVADYKWQAVKATSTFGSPVVAGETAAIVSRAGVLYRLDLETGEKVSTGRIDAGGIWATPIVSGDKLYLFGYKGTTSVVSLDDGKQIASNRCWDATGPGAKTPGFGGGNVLYAAAIAGDRLIIRRGDKLYAIGK